MMVVPTNYETWIICCGRKFSDFDMFNNSMTDIIQLKGCPEVVVHGAATGADSMANGWAQRMAVRVRREPALWDDIDVPGAVVKYRANGTPYNAAAGGQRNQKMLDDYKINMVVAFPGGPGTADMVARARKAGISVAEIKPKVV